jgi:hypothetical protein
VWTLKCRSCKSEPYSADGVPPASRVAVGFMSTTSVNAHSYIEEDVLEASTVQALRGSTFSTASEIQSTAGQSRYAPIGDEVSLAPLREKLVLHRSFTAFVVASLTGFLFQCFVCGPTCLRISTDACVKVYRYCVGNSSTQFWLPGAVLWQPSVTEPMLMKLQRTSTESSSCSGPGGSARFQAAEGKGANQAKDLYGIYTIACGHESCVAALEMSSNEKISSHVVLAMAIAYAMGCEYYFNDVMCILRAHVAAQGGRSLDEAFASLLLTLPALSPLAEVLKARFPITLESLDNEIAQFTIRCRQESVSGPAAATPQGHVYVVAPSTPSDFDVEKLIMRLLQRACSTGKSRVLFGAIPSLHAYLHQCNLGAYATPGAGAGHEYSEWVHNRALSLFAAEGRILTAEHWRLFHGSNLAFYNQRLNLDLAHHVLRMWVRAQASLRQRHDSLQKERACYVASCGGIADVSLVRLNQLSAEARPRSLQPAGAAALLQRMNRAAKALELSAVIGALDAIHGAVHVHPVFGKEALLMTLLDAATDRGLKLPDINSVVSLAEQCVKLKKSQAALLKDVGSLAPNPNAAIALQLTHLHALSTVMAQAKLRLQLHLAEGGAKDGKRKALRIAIGTARGNLKRCLDVLRRLLPLSSEALVRDWVIPELSAISCPADLPSRLGTIVVVPGDAAQARLVEAYNAHRAAATQLQHISAEMGSVLSNLDAVIQQQLAMLHSLAEGDLITGSGASGLMGGPLDAMFNFANLSSAPDASVQLELADGMAHHVAHGLSIWQEQRRQVTSVLEAVELLVALVVVGDESTFVKLASDKLGRTHAMRYARKMLSGQMTVQSWVAVASTGVVPQAAVLRRSRVTARRRSMQVGDMASESFADTDAPQTCQTQHRMGDESGAGEQDGLGLEIGEEEEEEEDGVPSEQNFTEGGPDIWHDNDVLAAGCDT